MRWQSTEEWIIDYLFQHRVLMADIEQKVIIGMDIIRSQDFTARSGTRKFENQTRLTLIAPVRGHLCVDNLERYWQVVHQKWNHDGY